MPSRAGIALVLAFAIAFLCAACAPRPRQAQSATAEQVLAEAHRPGARVVVLNVWGTWCVPCREEFPDLVRLRRQYAERGLRLILLSVDSPDQRVEVNRFLAEQGVDFPSYIRSGGDDNAFIAALSPRWSGALPATFLYDGDGRLRDFWEGKASYAQMESRMLRVLESGG